MANEYFKFKQFTVWQQQCAMKVGTDGTTLGAWARLPHPARVDMYGGEGSGDSALAGVGHILDIGTGTGLIALMMAQRFPYAQVTGIDIDETAVLQARANAEASPFVHRVTILHEDVALVEGCYDAIVCNPPYFTASLHCPDALRTMARHDDTLTYAQLSHHAWRLLGDGGELSVVIPKSRECLLKTSPTKSPKRVLLAYRKHPVASIERQTLVIGSKEYDELTKDFYL